MRREYKSPILQSIRAIGDNDILAGSFPETIIIPVNPNGAKEASENSVWDDEE